MLSFKVAERRQFLHAKKVPTTQIYAKQISLGLAFTLRLMMSKSHPLQIQFGFRVLFIPDYYTNCLSDTTIKFTIKYTKTQVNSASCTNTFRTLDINVRLPTIFSSVFFAYLHLRSYLFVTLSQGSLQYNNTVLPGVPAWL